MAIRTIWPLRIPTPTAPTWPPPSNLGAVYSNTRRFGDAESAFKEAVAIRRDLIAQNPAA
jgi:hypothetical protein